MTSLSFVRGIYDALGWCLRLGAKFTRAVPGPTGLVVLATLVSQASMLLASFLPLKVVILLGSEGIPTYFPQTLASFDRDSLIIALSVTAIVFYLLYVIMARVINYGTEKGVKGLLDRSQKLVLFSRQEEVAAKAYREYASSFAGAIFSIISFFLIFWLYPPVGWLIGGYILSIFSSVAFGFVINPKLADMLQKYSRSWMPVIGGVGFLLVFSYMVLDFLYGNPPGLIPAVIALLLSRQGFNKITKSIVDTNGLFQDRSRIDPLFFHKEVFKEREGSDIDSLWSLLDPSWRDDWIRQLIADLEGAAPTSVVSRWWQTGIRQVETLFCEIPGQGPRLVKIFGTKCLKEAQQEEILLTACPTELPAPLFLGVSDVNGFRCHLFGFPNDCLISRKFKGGDRNDIRYEINIKLLAVEPASHLKKRYARSHPFLGERIFPEFAARLFIFADPEEWGLIEKFEFHLPFIREQLQALPSGIINSEVSKDAVLTCDGEVVSFHWGRWRMDPVGAGWDQHIAREERVGEILRNARKERRSLNGVDIYAFQLAMLVSQAETFYRRERFLDVIDFLPDILSVVDLIKERAKTPPSATSR